jgi:hypothetical protein
MGMDADAANVIGRTKVDLGIKIQHQKGADPALWNFPVGKIVEDPEPVPDHPGGIRPGKDFVYCFSHI